MSAPRVSSLLPACEIDGRRFRGSCATRRATALQSCRQCLPTRQLDSSVELVSARKRAQSTPRNAAPPSLGRANSASPMNHNAGRAAVGLRLVAVVLIAFAPLAANAQSAQSNNSFPRVEDATVAQLQAAMASGRLTSE